MKAFIENLKSLFREDQDIKMMSDRGREAMKSKPEDLRNAYYNYKHADVEGHEDRPTSLTLK